ncbi:MAG: diaminopimelate epimerase [Oligoflexales bacterium]
MFIDFEKWEGCLNDFIIVRFNEDPLILKSLIASAPKLCRRDGSAIGADGIILIHETSVIRDTPDPRKITIINSDGSLASTCGNGIRCAAKSIYDHLTQINKRNGPDYIELLLQKQSVVCRVLKGKNVSEPLISVAMGIPTVNEDASFHTAAQAAVQNLAKEIGHPKLTNDYGVCELSNNHIVFFLDNIDRDLLLKTGPKLQKSNGWDGINVHLVRRKDMDIQDQERTQKIFGDDLEEIYEALVWERGAGETKACGSGACAIAAVSYENQASSRSGWIAIDMPGGRLYCRQSEEGDEIVLAGPAQKTFTGKFEI